MVIWLAECRRKLSRMKHLSVAGAKGGDAIGAAAIFILLLAAVSLRGQSGNTDFYGRVVDKDALCTQASGFMSEQDVERLISDMLAMQGLKNRFIVVGCQSVTNCIATVDKDKRPVILFNPSFLQRVQKLQFSSSDLPVIGERDWTTLTILAHELGHHMNNHLTNPLPNATAYDKELEADETAGFLLYLMGGQLAQGKQAFREASETGSYTHPPRSQRYDALTRGYNDASKRFPRTRVVVKTDPEPVRVVNLSSVTIGRQVWMSGNLDVDRFRNGDPILEARTAEEWKAAGENRQPAWCYHNNDAAGGAKYGRLYNWYAVIDPRGLAPEGWHVATDAEWKSLIASLGGNNPASVKLRAKSGWPEGNGTNTSGFGALPGEQRGGEGGFSSGVRTRAIWWTSTLYKEDYGIISYLDQSKGGEPWGTNRISVSPGHGKGAGCSVRCVRD